MNRIENDASNNSSVACIFVAIVTFLPNRCIELVGGYRCRHRLIGGIYEIAVEMGSGSMIYIPSFIKIGSLIQ
jgi:hypothetical protein